MAGVQRGQHSPDPPAFGLCGPTGSGSSPHGRQLPAPTAARSLCAARAREQREKRDREIMRICRGEKKRRSGGCSWERSAHLLPADAGRPALFTHRKYLHGNRRTPHLRISQPWSLQLPTPGGSGPSLGTKGPVLGAAGRASPGAGFPTGRRCRFISLGSHGERETTGFKYACRARARKKIKQN